MTLQNRLLPTGEIVADSGRGTLTGNRGILHVADGVLGPARWRHKAWISCTLDYKNRRRQPMTGRKWTELFFLDEAVAMAAGHRPCATCRRTAWLAFQQVWRSATGEHARAPDIDAALHAARIVAGTKAQRRHTEELATLPPGTCILWAGEAHLVGAQGLQAYTTGGYRPAAPKQSGAEVTVLTPAPLVAVLRAGYRPLLHETAVV
ncbi:hypothetical protein SAMN05444339_101950 [Loktanella atrilutea]|uniref:Uncharacterized protein n=1 Tax=Loktanella atrilutea TaxID=366533 RepID=A0A1M4V4Z1_LOKAT|nr:hypothetical protein [Loktanella atrilutea]SHE64044.1 hypothetical protein SAMN05444339_101950 [Loktanella atrilutea]